MKSRKINKKTAIALACGMFWSTQANATSAAWTILDPSPLNSVSTASAASSSTGGMSGGYSLPSLSLTESKDVKEILLLVLMILLVTLTVRGDRKKVYYEENVKANDSTK